VLSPVSLNSLHTGHGLRLYHMLYQLAQRHPITLVHWDDHVHPAKPEGVDASMRVVPCVGPTLTRARGLAHVVRAFALRPPYPSSNSMREALERLLSTEAFDAVLAFHPALLALASGVRGIPFVADVLDEPVLGAIRDLRAAGSALEFARLLRFAASAARYERFHCRCASCCVVVSDDEARWLRRIVPRTPVRVVPNGVDHDYFRPTGAGVDLDSMVFTGRMDFPPNVAGVLHFYRRILPQIRGSRPRAHWTIVGANPSAHIQELQADPGVTVTGYVDDVRPYLESAAVVVSPLVTGGGIKNKVLEAWAMARPVVATRLGCAGLYAHDGENLSIANDPREFAIRVVALLDDPGAAQELGRAGRRTVIERYGWDTQASNLEAVLRDAIERYRRP
jgi:sugar transferase (PEP-CTERM/EpsH1 system associated)